MRFTGRAEFADGRPPFTDDPPPWSLHAPPPTDTSLYGDTPRKAALKLYWRMDAEAREACVRITVGPWTRDTRIPFPTYKGPPIGFDPRDGMREV